MPYPQLKEWLAVNDLTEDLVESVRWSPALPAMLAALRRAAPSLGPIAPTTYTLYREFERNGRREGYQRVYFARRAQLARAVVEIILGDDSMRDIIHDLLWSICEETSWVLPAHEEQGPDFWDLHPSPRQRPWGAHTALTREPDAIDLFAAETGASLAEAVYLVGDKLAPEVVQRVRQEVERHIFKPYLAYGRKHWWQQGALNWNGVCNGSIGLAFLRLERDPQTLAEALEAVLEGFEAYIATGFEPDGGSIEGTGYWSYGLMYFVTLSEALRERTGGRLDLLADPRLRDVAHYPLVTALSPGLFVNFGDATEELALSPGIVQRLSERTGVSSLRGLLVSPDRQEGRGISTAKLAIVMRDIAWWDGKIADFPAEAHADAYLPACGLVKLTGHTSSAAPVIVAAVAGHNDGHHSHTDVGSFIVHVGGESLLCDPGRGLYSREYFRQSRYDNVFCNSFGHGVPRIGGKLQSPGPEFGGKRQYSGQVLEQGRSGGEKHAVVELKGAYDLPDLRGARRTLTLASEGGEVTLADSFAFDGAQLPIEEALVTWATVSVDGGRARVEGRENRLSLAIEAPAGAVFVAQALVDESAQNEREGILTRLAVALPDGCTEFRLRITPESGHGTR